jgi:hypothetical protein
VKSPRPRSERELGLAPAHGCGDRCRRCGARERCEVGDVRVSVVRLLSLVKRVTLENRCPPFVDRVHDEVDDAGHEALAHHHLDELAVGVEILDLHLHRQIEDPARYWAVVLDAAERRIAGAREVLAKLMHRTRHRYVESVANIAVQLLLLVFAEVDRDHVQRVVSLPVLEVKVDRDRGECLWVRLPTQSSRREASPECRS